MNTHIVTFRYRTLVDQRPTVSRQETWVSAAEHIMYLEAGGIQLPGEVTEHIEPVTSQRNLGAISPVIRL